MRIQWLSQLQDSKSERNKQNEETHNGAGADAGDGVGGYGKNRGCDLDIQDIIRQGVYKRCLSNLILVDYPTVRRA